MTCDKKCPNYENDGVCNVPNPCPIGSDCADCMTLFPTIQLVATIVSFLMLATLLSVVCTRLCRNQRARTRAERQLLKLAEAVDPTADQERT